ncbi:MAG: PilZ domain-containing protein [Candidatus Acidiferrales bacterium]
MNQLQTAPKPSGNEGDRRRSTRVLLVIAVDVSWTSKDGLQVQEHAETEVVSQHGAMLRMSTRLPVGMQVEVRRPANGQATKARVVGVGNPSPDGMARVAVELTVPSDAFWGISFPPLTTSAAAKNPIRAGVGKPVATPIPAKRR